MKTTFRTIKDENGKIAAVVIEKDGMAIYMWRASLGGNISMVAKVGSRHIGLSVSRSEAKQLLATV